MAKVSRAQDPGAWMFFAHSTTQADQSDWEPYADHWQAVRALAMARGAKFGAAAAVAAAAEFHDLGKLTAEFQHYIAGGQAKGPDHSTAGARALLAMALKPHDRLMAEVLAYGVAGHHAGLPDKTGGSDGTLEQRLAREDLPVLDPSWRTMHPEAPGALWPPAFKPEGKEASFQLAFLGRMIFSCLVDADFLATEAFYGAKGDCAIDRTWPALPAVVADLIAGLDRHRATLPRVGLAPGLLAIREQSFQAAIARAAETRGVFTLDLPTGAGKTLTSLGFALHHAAAHGLDRIIYAIPFTSVIDQTATIFRTILGEDIVLEHHSAIEVSAEAEEGATSDAQSAEAKRRRAAENWQAPIVVTTNVQLFESLFAHRPSRCRKLHNIARSVIILDECQTVPLHVLKPAVAALRELCRFYGCSVVLCTATQPALIAPRFAGGFVEPRPLVAESARLHTELRRVTSRLRGRMSDEDLIGELGQVAQGLVIVNSRGHALTLYHAARNSLGKAGLIHLSTRQTAADRKKILDGVKRDLAEGRPCRVVATSLIEAGIDISFPRAWRAEAGLDQIIQAAGRVNREGRTAADVSFIDIFIPDAATMPAEIKRFADVTRLVAARHGDDLFSPAAITAYFQEVYWWAKDGLDRTMMSGLNGMQPQAVMDQFKVSRGSTDFAYRTVGETFRLIKDGMEPVIITQNDKAKSALDDLARGHITPGAAAQRLQTHIVQVPPFFRKLLLANQHARFLPGFGDQFCILMKGTLYEKELGLAWEQAGDIELEQSII